MGKHYAKVFFGVEGHDATFIIDCDTCGRHEYHFHTQHITTFVNVLTSAAAATALAPGHTELLMGAQTTDPSKVPEITHAVDRAFDEFKQRRKGSP